jgi:hypothetical protein
MPRAMLNRALHEWRYGIDPTYRPDLRTEKGDDGTDAMVLESPSKITCCRLG